MGAGPVAVTARRPPEAGPWSRRSPGRGRGLLRQCRRRPPGSRAGPGRASRTGARRLPCRTGAALVCRRAAGTSRRGSVAPDTRFPAGADPSGRRGVSGVRAWQARGAPESARRPLRAEKTGDRGRPPAGPCGKGRSGEPVVPVTDPAPRPDADRCGSPREEVVRVGVEAVSFPGIRVDGAPGPAPSRDSAAGGAPAGSAGPSRAPRRGSGSREGRRAGKFGEPGGSASRAVRGAGRFGEPGASPNPVPSRRRSTSVGTPPPVARPRFRSAAATTGPGRRRLRPLSRFPCGSAAPPLTTGPGCRRPRPLSRFPLRFDGGSAAPHF